MRPAGRARSSSWSGTGGADDPRSWQRARTRPTPSGSHTAHPPRGARQLRHDALGDVVQGRRGSTGRRTSAGFRRNMMEYDGVGRPHKKAPLTQLVSGAKWSGRQDLNLRPLGPEGPNADPHGVVPGHLASYPVDNTGVVGVTGSHTVAPLPPVATPFGALVVRGVPGALLTVREVAARLRVSRATVYRLVQGGAVPVLRVSNSIRIPAAALARGALPEQLAMRAQADELEGLRVRLPVDGQEVRP